MPIYEYHCDKCGEDFEYLVIGEPDPDCPACNSKNARSIVVTGP